MENQVRVLNQDVKLSRMTVKAGTQFEIISIKFCVMKIKVNGKNKVANLKLVKPSFSSPVN